MSALQEDGHKGRATWALILAIAALSVTLFGCVDGNGIQTIDADERVDNRFTYSDDIGFSSMRFSTVTDTHTGIVYLVFHSHSGSSSVGGITVLLDSDGKPTRDPRYVNGSDNKPS